ncbi:MAG TPA: hypothetical protein VNJ71_02565 [Gemmatimonadales bacterium]|nr:hypothetical protein [Gemmatimonadales bacterium]
MSGAPRGARRTAVPAITMCLCGPAGLAAQARSLAERAPEWRSWSATVAAPAPQAVVGTRDSYWREGLIVGAAAPGMTGGLLAHELRVRSDVADRGSCTGRTILGSLVGAGVGAGVGTLGGGLVHRSPPKADSRRRLDWRGG